jgi:hypothetical protein
MGGITCENCGHPISQSRVQRKIDKVIRESHELRKALEIYRQLVARYASALRKAKEKAKCD